MNNEQSVTVEYLLAHGFRPYKTAEEGDCCEMPFFEERLHFREIEFSRQMFVVVFSELLDNPDQIAVDYVYVQVDAGCGFIEIPFPWVELKVEQFEAVYFGIRGHKPKLNPENFSDTEYEIIDPKRLSVKH